MLCKIVVFLFFFFKQKTAYEMRISDWSSDVCSSDLARDLGWITGNPFALITPPKIVPLRTEAPFSEDEIKQLLAVAYSQFRWFYPAIVQIGRASCRERVCQYV